MTKKLHQQQGYYLFVLLPGACLHTGYTHTPPAFPSTTLIFTAQVKITTAVTTTIASTM
ncbi:MAG: hypothetical protein R2769_04890 [Saprospiraceae bacterium]